MLRLCWSSRIRVLAADLGLFALGGKPLQRQATPQVGGGGAPGTVLLARDKAADQRRQVVLPARQFQHRQDQARTYRYRRSASATTSSRWPRC